MPFISSPTIIQTLDAANTVIVSFNTKLKFSGSVLVTNPSPGETEINIGAIAGTVNAVTASAPVVSSGGSTPNISMPVATGSVDGYLSSTDWNTFNNKFTSPLTTKGDILGYDTANARVPIGTNGQVLTADSTQALGLKWSAPSGGTVTAVSASAPLASSGGATPNLTISQAGVATDGYLSSVDWNIFNNKQSAGAYITSLTGDVTATGPGAAAATLANTAVTPGTYNFSTITVDSKGRVTAASGPSTILAVANGGTNSGTALNNNRIMVSVGGAIVEQSALTASAPMRTTASGLPTTGNLNLATEVTGILALANGGTGASTASAARVNLNIDERTAVNNANYTILPADRYVAQTGTMTAPRTFMLPAASSVNPGQLLIIIDESGTVSTTNTIIIARAGADTINNTTSSTLRSAYGRAALYSDGVSKWTDAVQGVSRGGTGLTVLPTDGQLLIGSTANGNYSQATITAGTGIAVVNSSGGITISASGAVATTTKTANYTITSSDSIIFCDSSGGAFNLTLPNPSTVTGQIFRVIDKTGFFATNNVTLVRFGGELIEGLAASKALQTSWGFFNIISDGTNWYVG